jgi:NAD(P)-dependent dehydrogenase (short-subunit alcohol dehydrogenase family)
VNYSVNLDGKVALVTGGSRGLGAAMSRGLARSGARVAVASRDVKRCEAVAEEIERVGGEALAVRADASDSASLAALLDAVYGAYGRLDILVNNAGIHVGFRPLSDLSPEDFDAIYAVNLRGPWYLASRAAPRMGGHGGGSIVNVLSVGGLKPPALLGFYAATKAGLHALTKVMAQEWAPLNVRVNAIAPGSYHSDLFDENARTLPGFLEGATRASPMQRVAATEEILGPLLYLVSDASSFTTGATLVADGGYLTL